ncbi:5-hydroxytryptamine receptor 1F [Hydra vulgaris]|uniref:5-hydroxytryptamine receptor 1F n=1 Tax=Hydra vulgaris TaxID=6087 RepID=A0ABM4CQE9_HYDVU
MNVTTYKIYKIACNGMLHFMPLRPSCAISIYISSSFLIALIPPTAILNVIAFAVILKTKKLHTPPNVLLASTALCDFLSAIISMPFWALVWLFALHEKHNCSIYVVAVFASHVLSYLSFLLVSFISIDRYLAIFKPFFYEEKIAPNPHYYARSVIALTLIVIVINGLSLLTPNKKLIEIVILLSLPPFILQSVYIHLKVLQKVNEVRKMISAFSIEQNGYSKKDKYMDAMALETSEQSSCTKLNEDSKNNQRKIRRMEKQVNIYHLTFILLVSVVMCYMPYISITIMLRIMPQLRYEEWTNTTYMWSYFITCIKSLANPLMYCFRSRMLREQIRKTSRKFKNARR